MPSLADGAPVARLWHARDVHWGERVARALHDHCVVVARARAEYPRARLQGCAQVPVCLCTGVAFNLCAWYASTWPMKGTTGVEYFLEHGFAF